MPTRIVHRFLVVLILLTALPMALLGAASYRAARKALTGTALMHMETIAEDHKNHLDFWFRERLQDLTTVASLPPVRMVCTRCSTSGCPIQSGTTLEAVRASLRSVTGSPPLYESMALYSADGRLLAAAGPQDKAPRPAPIRPPKEPTFGTPLRGPDGLWHVSLAAPIQGEEGKPVGTVVATVNMSQSLDPMMTDRAGLGSTGRTYLLTPQREIVTRIHALSDGAGEISSPHSFAIEQVLAGQSGAGLYKDFQGREVVGAYRWLSGYRLGLLAEMTTREILAPVQWMLAWTVAAVAALLLSCFILAWAAAGRMSQPIVEMSEAARRMADGDFSVQINASRRDELGILAQSFNEMSRRTAQTLEELRANERSLRRAYQSQKVLQRRLVQSEKLAAVGELVAGVVHEMRNPLSSVKLNLQILQRSLDREGPLAEHFSLALEQVKLLENMFRDLLDYSKPLQITARPEALELLVERALEQASAEVSLADVRVEKELDRDLPFVEVDGERAVQVLVNVIKNSVQNADGPLRLRFQAAVKEDPSGSAPVLRLAVQDTGPGIPPQHVTRLFQPFFTTRTKGTGLGLSMVKKIMDAHGGSVEIESTPGRGTTVHLDFPISGSEPHAEDPHH
ncbi:Signal transduction histidine kinase [Desulfacinum hydrothermale DSM 13146]|uniref:histidine kinase n=1 Tax=Desulfacinum hydrothermale DSM 13146 TaxID=1121390 RepID=A0A1W1XEY9_9BACT|nr:ATP-binding protein [Desulfacinum hydrothermale]SMC22334.1 Signal transduction histidine kinase [Desulfacinum hydrothermale DSM 13146]